MKPTAPIDARSNDRPDLAGRVERVMVEILSERIEGDIRPSHYELDADLIEEGLEDEKPEPVGRDYFQVRAIRNAENPFNSGIYMVNAEVIGRGQISPSDIDQVETIFATAEHLSCEFRDRAERHGIALPSGRPVSFSDAQGQRTGAGQDFEVRWTFNIHAQALEITEAAAA